MFNEMIAAGGGGGGGGSHLVEIGLTHTMNNNSITRSVSIDGTALSSDTISASNSGNNFDATKTFNAGSTSVSWRAYHSTADPLINNDITINGVTATFTGWANTSLTMSNNLSNPYTWTFQFIA